MSGIRPVVMPKWGLAMQEGTLSSWLVAEGDRIAPGDEIAEIETSKIANVLEATVGGTVRRLVAEPGRTLPVAALLAVVADDGALDAEIDAFVESYRAEDTEAAGDVATAEERLLTVGGRQIRCVTMGAEGPPVVLVHGFGGDLGSFLFTQPALAEVAQVHAFDLPGHGGSAKEVGSGDPSVLVETLAGLLDALGLESAHLVGHSLGGAVALSLALAAPARVRSLTLVAPAGFGSEIDAGFIDGFIALERRREARAVLERLVADPALISRDMIEDVLRYKRIDGVKAALSQLAGSAFPGGRQALDLKGRIAALTMPVQVIWGGADRILPAAQADGLPGAVSAHVLPGVGHLAHMEAAQAVNRLIREMLER